MKNKDLQDQLSSQKRRAYYTTTYTGEDATKVVNFQAEEQKVPAQSSNKTGARLMWIAILLIAAYVFLQDKI